MFSCEIYEISKNTFFYRTATVAASEVELVFLKESRTKSNAIASNTYQISPKKGFAAGKIQNQLL